MSLQVIIHREFEVLERILPKWKEISENFIETTVFQDISWLKSWWIHQTKKRIVSPYIIEIIKKNETIGIIPLYCTIRKFDNFKFRVLQPIGYYHADYLLPILSKEYSPKKQIKSAFDKIYEDRKNWDFIDWGDIPEGSTFDKYLSEYLAEGDILSNRNRTFVCPYITLNLEFEEVKAKYNQKLVKELLKKIKKLKKTGLLHYHLVTGMEEIRPILNIFFEWHCDRWANTNTPSKFESSEERAHFLDMAINLHHSNLLHLSYLKYNDEIVAVESAMVDTERIYLYLTAFNKEYGKYSVGNILLYKLIEHACKEGYQVVDFTRGDESYKKQWGTKETYNVQYFLFHKSLLSNLSRLINRTYYSDKLQKGNRLSYLAIKCFIRGSVKILSIYERLKYGEANKYRQISK